MRHQTGFSLMELMIVIALILIILAIAIPSMKEAKIHADEAAAVASVRAINTAEMTYQATYGGYADSLANLGGAEPCTKSAQTACLLDQSLAGGVKSGYNFAATGGNPSGGENTSYVVGAAPEVFDRTGQTAVLLHREECDSRGSECRRQHDSSEAAAVRGVYRLR